MVNSARSQVKVEAVASQWPAAHGWPMSSFTGEKVMTKSAAIFSITNTPNVVALLSQASVV